MAVNNINHYKLGIFVLAGLLFLVVMMYMIGKNKNVFGSTYGMYAEFENVQGLLAGNNVRYAGIQVGTVKKITILNDSTLNVYMLINKQMQHIIKKDAQISIGTDGLVGNKVVNISPTKGEGGFAHEGYVFKGKKTVDTEEMIQTLFQTNNDIAVIANNLKEVSAKLNNSESMWELLNDKAMASDIKDIAHNISNTTQKAENLVDDLQYIIKDTKEGKGNLGKLLRDTTITAEIEEAIVELSKFGKESNIALHKITTAIEDAEKNIRESKGSLKGVIQDSMSYKKLANSIENVEKGTMRFNESMEAIQKSFLFRRYFKKRDKENTEPKN